MRCFGLVLLIKSGNREHAWWFRGNDVSGNMSHIRCTKDQWKDNWRWKHYFQHLMFKVRLRWGYRLKEGSPLGPKDWHKDIRTLSVVLFRGWWQSTGMWSVSLRTISSTLHNTISSTLFQFPGLELVNFHFHSGKETTKKNKHRRKHRDSKVWTSTVHFQKWLHEWMLLVGH